MAKIIEKNERLKRAYLKFLAGAKGQDDKSLEKVAAALFEFEAAVGNKDFKAFHRDWGERFKAHLGKARNQRTNLPLSHSTVDSTLRMIKNFVTWLADQPGYKSRVTYTDAEYFNNNAKSARIAHTTRHKAAPTLEQAAHAFQAMPVTDDVQRRNKALFALLMLTGARIEAASSLRIGDVNLFDGHVYQDARHVRTKNGKSIDSFFFPVDEAYRTCLSDWITYLREVRLFGPDDALFPKCRVVAVDGKFGNAGLAREPYKSAAPLSEAIRESFVTVQLPAFTPHSFRTTLARLMDQVCGTMEQRKAWSQNLGHEHLATTVSSYMPVPPERQKELLRGLGQKETLFRPPD